MAAGPRQLFRQPIASEEVTRLKGSDPGSVRAYVQNMIDITLVKDRSEKAGAGLAD